MDKTISFFHYMNEQVSNTPSDSLEELIAKTGNIEQIYLVFVDIIKGFCEEGALASDRVNEMVKPVQQLTESWLNQGLPTENLIFLHDNHPTNAVEFAAFAPHCIKGTAESEIVDALQKFQQLPSAQTYHKNATSGMFGKNDQGVRFFEWLENRFEQGNSAFVLVGDCTDLCIYQNAMGIRLLANENNAEVDVVIPISHVRTYDVSLSDAKQYQILAHDADVMDLMFLYHMQLNGVRLVKSIV